MSTESLFAPALAPTVGKDISITESARTYANYFKKIYEEFAPFLSAEKSFHDNDALGEVEQWSRTHSLLLGDGSVCNILICNLQTSV
jgi:hypothetical protein